MTKRQGTETYRQVWLLAIAGLIGAAVLLTSSPASAQYQDPTDDVRLDEEFDDNEYYIVGRMRAVGIPNFMLGIGFDRHSANWRNGEPNFAYGAEFVWRKVDAFELSVAAEYADLGMPGDFWKESNESAREADWVDFELGVVSLVFSGYFYWEVTEWFSPFLGGGVGLGVTLNNVDKYSPSMENSGCRSTLGEAGQGFAGDQCFQDGGIDKSQFDAPQVEDRIWPVVPMINVTAGARFNIRHHGVLKLEVGFYDYLFAGLSGGVQW